MSESNIDTNALHLLRDLAPQVLGVVARRYGDFAAAEDAVQEALIAASEQWPRAGIPTNPRGWLYQVAIRRLNDHIRREASRRKREDVVATQMSVDDTFIPPPDAELGVEMDDTLNLLFMCCHPALTRASAIALTLRAVGGLTTAEIASAFLVPEATMAQRISRAKLSIKSSNIPFATPDETEREDRLDAVLHVLYLIFSEGYTSSAGSQLNRTDLSNEAIRLARAVRGLLPEDGEVAGLLALMLLTDARRTARTGEFGQLIPLDEQDRSVWDREMIAEGVEIVSAALARGAVGSYQLQAAVASVHDEAKRVEDTDWPQIVWLYSLLAKIENNPIVSLNKAVAVAMMSGPMKGLELIHELEKDPRIAGHYRIDAVRAHLLELVGDYLGAIANYRSAAQKTLSIPERDYLQTKAARLKP